MYCTPRRIGGAFGKPIKISVRSSIIEKVGSLVTDTNSLQKIIAREDVIRNSSVSILPTYAYLRIFYMCW